MLAGPLSGIQCCPDFSQENVLHRGNGQRLAKHIPLRGAGNERLVTRIELNLHAQIAAGTRDIQAVPERFDAEFLFKERPDSLDCIGREHQIEIVGGKLREMMPWIKANRLVDKTKN